MIITDIKKFHMYIADHSPLLFKIFCRREWLDVCLIFFEKRKIMRILEASTNNSSNIMCKHGFKKM
jgi:hypothetical protein